MTPERTEQEWLDRVRTQVLRGDAAIAQALLIGALAEHPGSFELRRAQAGIHRQSGRLVEAEALLRDLLREKPADAAAAFALGRILKEQGRMAAAADLLGACMGREPNLGDANLAINAVELLDDCGRKEAAAALVLAAIGASPGDPRLHAYAGMLQMQLGRFEVARRHYLTALQGSERGWEWHVPIGLAFTKRYADAADPDLALFRAGLQREGLTALARAELCFALGKAYDDLGRYEKAVRRFREGNAIAHSLANWSSEAWTREIAALPVGGQPLRHADADADFTPVFIVGMPRSGTTLLAELLSRNPCVCNRGELPWIDRLARALAPAGGSRQAFEDAAAIYRMQCRQDDGGYARWFVDKQPLNFRYVDLVLALFPHARIVYCRRSPRDTALSLWTQLFADETLGFTYDFADIARVMADCRRLMAQASASHPSSVYALEYEALVVNPGRAVGELAAWLGLPEVDGENSGGPSVVSTSSLWQVRQPVYRTSVERWRRYAEYVPELLEFPET